MAGSGKGELIISFLSYSCFRGNCGIILNGMVYYLYCLKW